MSIRTLAALAGAVSAANIAAADVVNLDFVGRGAGRAVTLSLSGFNGGSSFGVFAGQLKHSMSGGTGSAAGLSGIYRSFCTEISQHVYNSASPNSTIYTVQPIQNLPSPGVGMGPAKAQAIADLFAFTGYDIGDAGVNSDLASAFQVALWEIVYDGPANMDLGNGALKISGLSATAQGHFDAFKANLFGGGNLSRLMGFSSPSYQDQIILIPLPAAAWAGLGGLAVAAIARRRFAR